MSLSLRQKNAMDSYLVHRFTMLIQVGEFFLSLIEFFTAAEGLLPLNQEHPLQWQDVEEQQLLLTS